MEIQLQKHSLKDQRILLRLDLDVPISPTGQVSELARLQSASASLKCCLDQAKQILIIGHLDRPQAPNPKLSLKQLLPVLQELINQPISFVESPETISAWQQSGSKLGLLENLRFWPGEASSDQAFAKQLASGFDYFVNDAFAASHRSAASITVLPGLLPTAIGIQMEEEINGLQRAFNHPTRPVVMILGGNKADKMEFVDNFITSVDNLLIGGRLVDHSPQDPKILAADLTPDGFDITDQSIQLFKDKIASAGTIIWNGPLGKFEDPTSAKGTRQVAQAIADSSAHSILGGGDTIAAINQFGLADKYGFVSLGGGAMLYFLAHHTLPALEAIR